MNLKYSTAYGIQFLRCYFRRRTLLYENEKCCRDFIKNKMKNNEKYGPEKSPDLDTFHAVISKTISVSAR